MAIPVLAPKVVRISVPPSIAGDLGKMQRITKDVLGKLGCRACHSGFDIRFLEEIRFSYNEKLRMINR